MTPFLTAFPTAAGLMLTVLEREARYFDALHRRTGGTCPIRLLVDPGVWTALELGRGLHYVDVGEGRRVALACGTGPGTGFTLANGWEFEPDMLRMAARSNS